MDEYQAYISRCKKPKHMTDIRRILTALIAGAKHGWDNATLATKMNTALVLTLMGKRWSANNIAMAILKSTRFDTDSSLAYGLASMLQTGEMTNDDLALLRSRTRLA